MFHMSSTTAAFFDNAWTWLSTAAIYLPECLLTLQGHRRAAAWLRVWPVSWPSLPAALAAYVPCYPRSLQNSLPRSCNHLPPPPLHSFNN